MVHIDVLYFEGCPSWQHAWNDLSTVLADTGVVATVRLVDVMSLDERGRRGFGGSPSIHVDGHDLEGYEGEGVLACRRYDENEGRGWPSMTLLRARLTAAPDSGTARATEVGRGRGQR
jgi:hypothetical protein